MTEPWGLAVSGLARKQATRVGPAHLSPVGSPCPEGAADERVGTYVLVCTRQGVHTVGPRASWLAVTCWPFR